MAEERRLRFRLRTLFCVIALGAVLSEFARWFHSGGVSPFFVGLAAFFYGGITAIASYVVVTTGLVLAGRSTCLPRFAIELPLIVFALVWLSAVVFVTFTWPPICALYVAVTATVSALMVRNRWEDEQGISPERTLKRLLHVKAQLSDTSNRNRR
jgi:hypothetical protein